ncbi:LysE family transporter [Sphingosinicellaceae bacterium]|nr:LysE family transporter [Sphingosinicellaceae bacterium]
MIDLSNAYLPAGIGIGLAAAAPVGPINLLVIQRTLTRGQPAALLTGSAGALGDAIFAAVAAFGLGAVRLLLAEHGGIIRIVGGLIMLVFAVVVWRASPHIGEPERELPTPRLTAMVLGMTLTNPATLFFFLGSFGAIGFDAIGHGSPQRLLNSAIVVGGVFGGSMLWWVVISTATRALRERVTDLHLLWLNRLTAAALAAFGIAAIVAGITR